MKFGMVAKEDRMNLKYLSAVLAAAGLLAATFAVTPADAAPRKQYLRSASPNVSYRAGPRTRVYITRRTWLDAGTEVLPGERKFLDYALPPAYSFADQLSPRGGFSRQPLEGPFDLPGNPGYH